MEKVLIKSAKIVHPSFDLGVPMDILIDHTGHITEISKKITAPADRVIEGKELYVSVGWLDIGTQIGEPGFEHKEDLLTVTKAALAGGYTALAPFPNTYPMIKNRVAVEHLVRFASHHTVDIFPIGAITDDKGHLTEMIDMHMAGAVAFSNGHHSLKNAGDLLRALQYVLPIGGLIINHPLDHSLVLDSEVNESTNTMLLGLKGIPALAESLAVKQHIELLQYTDSKILLNNITAAQSLTILKEKTLKNCWVSVSGLHLTASDDNLGLFDANYKIWPPLRGKDDQLQLCQAVINDDISIITSLHMPQGSEEKNLEFTYADFGAINLQTNVSAINTLTNIPIHKVIEKVSISPRNILGIDLPNISEGVLANLTIFDAGTSWTFDKKDNCSKSQNSPYFGTTFQGKVLGTIHRSQMHLN